MIKKILKIFVIIILYSLIALLSFFLYRIAKEDGDVKSAAISVLQDVADQITDAEPIYVLILGVSTDIKSELTDTIMLAGYNPTTQQAFIVSIPRDTFVGSNINKVRARDKINALYSTSVNETIKAVEEISGISIDHYVTIKTEMLTKIVDIIGGVEFDVPIDMKYSDKTQNLYINLKKGVQIIDGKEAEQLLRFRHNNDGTSYSYEYGNNDYGRMRTQRDFIKATLTQCLQVHDFETLKAMTSAVFKYIETDMELHVVLSYLSYLYDFSTDNLFLEQLPGESIQSSNDIWIFKHDEEKTNELLNNILVQFNNET